MKFTAAMAMPTPKSTPARTRFEPPSPNAKVNPDTTIATRERPRAIVLVNAVIKTLMGFMACCWTACLKMLVGVSEGKPAGPGRKGGEKKTSPPGAGGVVGETRFK